MRWIAATAGLGCALAAGGCAFQLASLASKDSSDTTGSLGPGDPAANTVAAQLSESDLAYARAAAVDALARGGKDTSVPWANPQTGAGGNITPLAAAYSQGGQPCRDFLASYMHGGSEDWLRGEACRTHQGKWEVKNMKPLKRS